MCGRCFFHPKKRKGMENDARNGACLLAEIFGDGTGGGLSAVSEISDRAEGAAPPSDRRSLQRKRMVLKET